jgi:hypothetical protein
MIRVGRGVEQRGQVTESGKRRVRRGEQRRQVDPDVRLAGGRRGPADDLEPAEYSPVAVLAEAHVRAHYREPAEAGLVIADGGDQIEADGGRIRADAVVHQDPARPPRQVNGRSSTGSDD